MAQKHNWSKKKGDAWCTRSGCDRKRKVSFGFEEYEYTGGIEPLDPGAAGPCGGDVPKTKESGKHDWALDDVLSPGQWRYCMRSGCPWQFNPRKERYRVRGATVLGEKRKPDPCKGAP